MNEESVSEASTSRQEVSFSDLQYHQAGMEVGGGGEAKGSVLTFPVNSTKKATRGQVGGEEGVLKETCRRSTKYGKRTNYSTRLSSLFKEHQRARDQYCLDITVGTRTDRRTDGPTHERTDARTDQHGRTDSRTDQHTDGPTHGRTNTRTNTQTDQYTDGPTHGRQHTDGPTHGRTNTRTDQHERTHTDGPTHGRTNTRTDQHTDGPIHGRTNTDGPTHGRTNTRTDQHTDGPTHGRTNTGISSPSTPPPSKY
ncbi:hypothetical protein Hamer_G007716 [Homarus americanus]|uniref:Uncharacterized protein n=1 Tax=Homarus americanus TaxID=6706 RepID=A0A8J5JTY4_HOMAM|nr:hypothetical protein Hamer_G007716 [Homarus americanus]